jgi:uncharacterized repeat protein (TIGR03803 family)
MQTGSAAKLLSRIFVTILLVSAFLPAQTFSVLHAFHTSDGLYAAGGQLVLDAEGNIYGIAGGGKGICFTNSPCGAVFKMNKSGKLLGFHSFDGPDGNGPAGGLLRDAGGNGFGVTEEGGVDTKACSDNVSRICGVVYKVSPTGKETVLHKFTNTPDGWSPESLLVEDSAGNLYGTTLWGGANVAYGIVFKLDQAGNETILYNFTGQADGGNPYAGVILDSSGNLYGTTGYGGNTGCGSQPGQGCGAVYKLSPSGQETVLYAFGWGTDGAFPSSGLIQDSAGNLYGEAGKGGNEQVYDCDGYEGCGVVYELSPNGKGGWSDTVLYAFNYTDGFEPGGGLVRDAAGNLYGVTIEGGENGFNCNSTTCGIVFKLDTSGNETVLHEFTGGTDGAWPDGGLAIDAAGSLYGTTQDGGDLNCKYNGVAGCGVVFKITP